MKLVKYGQYLQLSAPGIGKKVVFSPNTQEAGRILVKAANKGSYYPLMAIKHLTALSTGLTGKNNVFIPNINDFKTNSLQNVVVFVPGIAAMVERRPEDILVITSLTLSDGYDSIEKGSNQKPGVYSVKRKGGGIDVTYKTNGRISAINDRNVVIADPRYKSPGDAVEEVVNRLKDLFSEDVARKTDFDLFYSPLGSSLKGMRNYNPAVVNQTFGYAGILADAMEKSKNSKGVVWASERAGSVVMTQALMILAAKNLSFEEQNHIVKMRWAKSNPEPTYRAATQLGMLVDKKLLTSNSHMRATLSANIVNYERVKDKNDDYSWKDYTKDLVNGTMAANAAIGVATLGGSFALATSPVAPVLAGVGTVTGIVGALQFVCKKIMDVKERW